VTAGAKGVDIVYLSQNYYSPVQQKNELQILSIPTAASRADGSAVPSNAFFSYTILSIGDDAPPFGTSPGLRLPSNDRSPLSARDAVGHVKDPDGQSTAVR